jgi:endonuclease/exonuclease/phosphatase family metal-dependent hydrolase
VTLRLLAYNIEYGGVGREDAIAGVVKHANADLVILEEAYRPEVVRRLAAECGYSEHASRLGESVAFLSRVPVRSYEWRYLLLGRRRYLEIVTASGLRIFGIHLSAIHSNVTEQRRVLEVNALLRRTAPHRNELHILAGDFNTLASDAPFDPARLPARLRALYWLGGGRIRWRALAMILAAGYADAYRTLHTDGGFTFPTWDAQIRLDYVFLPAANAKALTACRVLYDAPRVREASDHYPLFTEVSV